MRQLTDRVYQFKDFKSGQSYLIAEKQALTLIDTGTSRDYKHILSQLPQWNFRIEDIKTIILTHAHLDHTANVTKIQHLSHAKIIAHTLEKPYLENTAKIRYPSLGKNMFWGIINALFAVKGITVDTTIKEGDVLAVSGGLQVIHTPGHTPGSIALYQSKQKILFTGDSLCNEGELVVMQGIYNTDDQELLDAVQKFRKLKIDIICVGHGMPISKNAHEHLEAMFDKRDFPKLDT